MKPNCWHARGADAAAGLAAGFRFVPYDAALEAAFAGDELDEVAVFDLAVDVDVDRFRAVVALTEIGFFGCHVICAGANCCGNGFDERALSGYAGG